MKYIYKTTEVEVLLTTLARQMRRQCTKAQLIKFIKDLCKKEKK